MRDQVRVPKATDGMVIRTIQYATVVFIFENVQKEISLVDEKTVPFHGQLCCLTLSVHQAGHAIGASPKQCLTVLAKGSKGDNFRTFATLDMARLVPSLLALASKNVRQPEKHIQTRRYHAKGVFSSQSMLIPRQTFKIVTSASLDNEQALAGTGNMQKYEDFRWPVFKVAGYSLCM